MYQGLPDNDASTVMLRDQPNNMSDIESNQSNENTSIVDKKKSKLRRDALKYREELDKRGVIYISRIPPHMKPNKVQSIFQDFGKVTRLYLAEEDPAVRKKRKESGGNGSRMFREGWIEFADKKLAKTVAESLNNTLIGGKKSSFYHDDMWNIKYLKNFKWDYLTEKLAYERRFREKKLQIAMEQEKRSNAEFAELVEKNNIQDRIDERKRKRSLEDNVVNDTSNANPKKRFFKQRQVLSKQHGEGEAQVFDSSLINNIFGSKKQKT